MLRATAPAQHWHAACAAGARLHTPALPRAAYPRPAPALPPATARALRRAARASHRCSAASDAPKVRRHRCLCLVRCAELTRFRRRCAQESSSLFRAAFKGRLDELRFLLAAGADVNSRDWVRPSRSRPLRQPNPAPQDGSTALIAAVYAEQRETAAMLLEAGADVAACSDDGDTALMFASMRGNAALIELLLDAGANVNAANKARSYDKSADACTRSWGLTHGLWPARAVQMGGTALMYAASNGHAAAVPLLLLRGADVTASDVDGRTAWDIAATVPPCQDAVRAALRGVRAEE